MRHIVLAAVWAAAGCTWPEYAGSISSEASSGAVQVNLLFVHGVENDAGAKSRAHNSLNDLKAAIASDMPALIASYQASHPDVAVRFSAASANLYTATP